jgi:hypothetical protein
MIDTRIVQHDHGEHIGGTDKYAIDELLDSLWFWKAHCVQHG